MHVQRRNQGKTTTPPAYWTIYTIKIACWNWPFVSNYTYVSGISASDIMTTPSQKVAQYKKDTFRTPGQILSLTTNFAFVSIIISSGTSCNFKSFWCLNKHNKLHCIFKLITICYGTFSVTNSSPQSWSLSICILQGFVNCYDCI